jgi:hypothetical protein
LEVQRILKEVLPPPEEEPDVDVTDAITGRPAPIPDPASDDDD